MAKRKKYLCYAVSVGRKPGIYRTWLETERQVVMVSEARQEGCYSHEEAQAYLARHGERVQLWDRDGVIIQKSNGRCWYCGEVVTDDLTQFGRGEIEHQVPSSRGGRGIIANLVLSCRPCNERKAAMTWEEFREPGQIFYGETLGSARS